MPASGGQGCDVGSAVSGVMRIMRQCMHSAILLCILAGGHEFCVADCHLLTAVPCEFDAFPKFISNGSFEATFPEQRVYCLNLIPILFLGYFW